MSFAWFPANSNSRNHSQMDLGGWRLIYDGALHCCCSLFFLVNISPVSLLLAPLTAAINIDRRVFFMYFNIFLISSPSHFFFNPFFHGFFVYMFFFLLLHHSFTFFPSNAGFVYISYFKCIFSVLNQVAKFFPSILAVFGTCCFFSYGLYSLFVPLYVLQVLLQIFLVFFISLTSFHHTTVFFSSFT